MEFKKIPSFSRSLPVSFYAIVVSFIVWAGLLFLLFVVISYINIGSPTRFEDAVKEECRKVKTLNPLQAQNFAVPVIQPSHVKRSKEFDTWARYLRLGSYGGTKVSHKADVPPFVTVVTSSYFLMVQGLLKQINEELYHLYHGKDDIKLIVFDLGLTDAEKQRFEEGCRCQLWKLNSNILPSHVTDIDSHSFRSIIIQTILAKYGSVVWMDPHTRLVTARVPEAIEAARRNGFALWHYSYPVPAMDKAHERQHVYNYEPVVAFTDPETFTALNENRCRYIDQLIIDSRLMIFYDDASVVRRVIEPWLTCVLQIDCVSPPLVSSPQRRCPSRGIPAYVDCHRHEMSVLSIVVSRLPNFDGKASFQPVIDAIPGRDFEPEEYFTRRFPSMRQSRAGVTVLTVAAILVIVIIVVIYVFRSTLYAKLDILVDAVIARLKNSHKFYH